MYTNIDYYYYNNSLLHILHFDNNNKKNLFNIKKQFHHELFLKFK